MPSHATTLRLALIAGPIRGIPFYWQWIDCAFGVLGFIPQWIVRRLTRQLAAAKPV
jgi:hypothetical protein